MQKLSIILIAAIMFTGAILLAEMAYNSVPQYPDRVKFHKVYKTVKFKRTVCSKCHSENVEWAGRI